MSKSTIEWTDLTWNVTTGCDKVSAGCKNCYAETIAKRFWKDRKFSDVQFHEDRLLQPLKWKKPQKIFVNSMSDLFHEKVTDEQLDRIFAVMALRPQHTFQVLTKRPQRMLAYFSQESTAERIRSKAFQLYMLGHKLGTPDAYTYWLYSEDGNKYFTHYKCPIPLVNVWLGVTTENQKTADERIPLLLQTPAAVRFLSCEPLLEDIELQFAEFVDGVGETSQIHWVIVGGESGHKARPCNLDWIRSIVVQCQLAEVPVFVKQLGRNPIEHFAKLALASKKGGDISEFPADLQIQEFPCS